MSIIFEFDDIIIVKAILYTSKICELLNSSEIYNIS